MSTVQEIEDAIRQLHSEDLAALRAWFAMFDAAAWDRQFEEDVAAGRLDDLAEEALQGSRERVRRSSRSVSGYLDPELRMLYKVAVHQSEEGYSVSVPGLPGCCSQGMTEAEALENIADAIREYLGVAAELAAEAELREVEVAL